MKRMISAGLAGLALISFTGFAAAATQLIVPLESSTARAKALGDVPMRFNREGLERLQPGADVELTLPNGSRHDYVYEQIIDHGGGFKTWIARSPLTGSGERAIITYGPSGSWGWMKTRYGDYRIYPSNKGYDLVAKRERQMLAPKWKGGDAVQVADDPPEIAPLKGTPTLVEPSFKSTLPKGLPGSAVQSDLMLIYTKDLADKLGVGLMPMLLNLVASVNQAYVDSEVAIVLRLVNATMIDHSNAHASDDTLDGMGGFGAFASTFQPLTWGVSSVRNTVAADFVALLRDGPTDTGGIGNLNRNPVIYPDSTAGQTSGYSVNNFCASGCEGILAHELGHNMGSHHDPHVIAYDSGTGTVNQTGVFPYSYGFYSCANGLSCNPYTTVGPDACTAYASCKPDSVGPPTIVNANDFGTIMSYVNPRVMTFSNPNLVTCVPPGGAPGSPRVCGGAVPLPAPGGLVANNALSLNNVRGALSAYRNQTITNLAGAVQFTNTTYSGAEGTNLTFTVSRTNGSSGSLTVSYAVTGGSATAGTDFTAASGTLTWANGDTANKSFN
ncbi:MAG TPA: M12 family metallo-peptidase, partial [Usitatibacter sp.]|nr:M12 family metallo-peptidase [Usitatibacter sp.]